MSSGQGGGGIPNLGPVIGILGQAVEGVGQLVHAVPVAGPVAQAVTQATGATVVGVGQEVGGVTQGLDTTLSGLTSAVKDLAGPTPSVIGQPAAEQGEKTSEFKMTAIKSLLLAVFGVLAAFGVGVSSAVQNVVVAVVPIAIAILGAGYSLSRGLRKRGSA